MQKIGTDFLESNSKIQGKKYMGHITHDLFLTQRYRKKMLQKSWAEIFISGKIFQ